MGIYKLTNINTYIALLPSIPGYQTYLHILDTANKTELTINTIFKMYLLLLCVWLHWIFVAVCGISLIVASEGLLYVVVHGLRVADCGFSFCPQFGAMYGVQGRRQWHPTPVHLPGISHGWRSLEGCSPWGR